MKSTPALRSWLLVAVSAGLQMLCFPTGGPMPAWRGALSWIALVPLLLALTGTRGDSVSDGKVSFASLRRGFLLGYGCGFLWYLGSCSWIYQTMFTYGGLSPAVSLLILVLFSLYLGLYHALFGLLFTLAGSGLRGARATRAFLLILAPFLWVAVEFARAHVTSFPWDLLGNAQVDNHWLTPLATVTGVLGLSFVVMAVNAAFAGAFLLSGKARWLAGSAAFFTVGTFSLAGLSPVPALTPAQAPERAVLLQENLEVGALGRGIARLTPAQELAVFSRASASLTPVRTPGSQAATVIVWPEAPSHLQSDEPAVRTGLEQLAEATDATVIAGALGVDRSSSATRGYYLYDSALVFSQHGSYLGRYDKIHLVPWGEYIPFKQFFTFAEKLTEGVGDMDRGVSRSVFQSGGHTYGIFICYESIFGDEVRQFVKAGAQVLVNISDDGWYGESGAPWQHLNMVRMRAIENHRWVLRSTNTGVTTAIDPRGALVGEAPRHVREAFAFPFAFSTAADGLTFYTQHGDWFAWCCVLFSALALLPALLPASSGLPRGQRQAARPVNRG